VAFIVLLIFSIIEMSIAAFLASKIHPTFDDALQDSAATNVIQLLSISAWTIFLGLCFLIQFLEDPYSNMSNVGFHFWFLYSTWITWMAFAGLLSTHMTGMQFCHIPALLMYCHQLQALAAFAWLNCIVMGLMVLFVVIRGCQSVERGDNFGGPMLET
ncbi:hypothetical protein M413DRAFT_78028, partial [Hebeloma cylindrosporum]